MKRILTLVLSCMFLSVASYAQQDPQFSQNMYNKLYTNPGYAGSNKALCATLLGRSQWMGFAGAPKTGLLSVDAAVEKLHGGIGGTVFSDQLGLESSFGAKLAYSFRLNVGPGELGIGAEVGMFNKSLKTGFVAIQSNDPLVPTSQVSATTFDFGLGVYYNTNNLYVGLSTTHIPQLDLSYQLSSSALDLSLVRHYYITLGYDYQLPVPSLVLRPSVYIKSDAHSTQVDGNVNLLYNNLFWGGVSYRLGDAIAPHIGLNLNNGLRFGVSYDVTTSSIRSYSSGSVELMLGYCMKLNSNPPIQIHKTVRFL